MPVKHQADCYRTIDGHRYINWGDVLTREDEAAVAAAKSLCIPHRVFRHPDGFRRLFIREDQAHRMP